MESLDSAKEYTKLMIEFANSLPGDNSYLIANLGYILEDINETLKTSNYDDNKKSTRKVNCPVHQERQRY